VVGAIAVEASPWFEDNLWLLEQCAASPFMLGAIGNLKPEAPEYSEYLARFSKHPLFLGIRYGNVWDYDLPGQSKNSAFIDGMKRLADAGLVWEMGNPRLDAFDAVFRVQDKVPQLKIVVEHLVGFTPPKGQEANYDKALQEFRSRGLIGKVSVPKPEPDNSISAASLSQWVRLYELFGEDRSISYGFITSPDHRASPGYEALKPYFAKKPTLAAEKYFWVNSQKIYRWKPRTPNQPHAA
jgi:predicted TIM-barrel fold metal-dependent hydrolase